MNFDKRLLHFRFLVIAFIFTTSFWLLACSKKPYPGPDKRGAGMLQGALVGAGSGAITGAQVSSATGPGAAVGAGLGAVAGSIKGMLGDNLEDIQMELAKRARAERELAVVHETLRDHYQRRVELHPTRDIYPADLFFYGDEVKLKPQAKRLVWEMAKLNKERFSWSRMAVVAYVKSRDENSDYALHLANKRAKELTNRFIWAGLEPRRLESRAVILDKPLLVDPDDTPGRYNQAIELIPIDR